MLEEIECGKCGGTGKITYWDEYKTLRGEDTVVECLVCRGTGKVVVFVSEGGELMTQQTRKEEPKRAKKGVVLGPTLPLNPDLTPVGSLIPSLLFIGHCLGCNRDTLLALVVVNGDSHYFCTLCGRYTLVGA